MQATSLTDAALLRRSTLAAVVEENPANPTSLTAARPTSAARDTFDRRHDQDQLEYSTDARLNPYMAPTRPESRYRDDSDRPSLADWGHAPSAPVPGSSRWYDSSSTPITNRPISVPLPSHAYDRGSPFSHQHQQHQQQHPQQSQPVAGSSSSSSSPHPYLGMSRLQQQWAKAPATQYQPYRMSIAPEPSRASGGGEPDREHPRMQPPSFAHFQPEPSAPLLPPPSSYPYSAGPLPSAHTNSAYTQPLSLTLPPLANSFPSEPFALTSTYPPPASNGKHYRYHSNGQASNDASEQADYSSNGHEQPSGVTEAYSASRQSGPLSVSLPRANNADPASYAESLAAAVPPGSAQPNSRKRKEPKDAASRKYACNECEQKFARPSALATHILTHTREKPFVCMTCSRGFAVMSNLRRHCRVRSHALAPSQESNAKRVGEYGSDLAGAGKGDADASPDDAVSAPSEIPLRPLPVAPSENTPTAFTLPAQSVYPP